MITTTVLHPSSFLYGTDIRTSRHKLEWKVRVGGGGGEEVGEQKGHL